MLKYKHNIYSIDLYLLYHYFWQFFNGKAQILVCTVFNFGQKDAASLQYATKLIENTAGTG